MKWLIANICTIVLDKMGQLHEASCNSFGGFITDDGEQKVRLCSRWRWHTDSHFYSSYISFTNHITWREDETNSK